MAYTFTNQPFKWTKEGTDPTESEIALGFQGGMALPAAFLNQQWSKTYSAIAELQSAIADGSAFAEIEKIAICGDDQGSFPNTVVDGSALVGWNTTVSGTGSFSAGSLNVINGNVACTIGTNLIANQMNIVVGKANKEPTATDILSTEGDVFVVGNGTSDSNRSNAFRVTAAGQCMGTTFFASSGADYSELFEWVDGNPDNEDRRGHFVTLDGEKIRFATAEDDYILGAISGAPTVIGDAATEDWHGKYEKDVFGARIIENGVYKLSEEFNSEQDILYTSRLDRAEWGVVGLTGKVVVIDDGTCEVNGYCYPSSNGIATASEKGYRVMSRIDDTHVRVLIK